jgi:Tol biopolymer transport system component
MKPIARQIFSMIIVGLVASVRFQNVAVGAEVASNQQQRFSIAVPDFPDSYTSDGTSGRDVAQTIIADLQADGRFTLVNSSITLEANAVLPQFDRWRSTNAEWLVTGSIRQSTSELLENGKRRPRVEIRLWNVVKGSHGHGWQYTGSSADLRRIPHLVAAEIVKQLTGVPDPSDATSDHPN